MRQAIAQLLASRKALILLLVLGVTGVGVALGKIPWDADTRNLLVQIISVWLGAQALEDAVLKRPRPATPVAGLSAVVSALAGTEARVETATQTRVVTGETDSSVAPEK